MQLIKIENSTIGADVKETVNARELHAFLEVGKEFANWMKDRIESFDFTENQDFVVIAGSGKNPSGGRPTKDYHLTLDMAKELSMVERNDKGKQARQYFIECERRAKSPGIAELLNNPQAMHMALLTYSQQVIERDKLISVIQPKAAIADRLLVSDGLLGFRQVAKTLSLNENKLRGWLIQNDWIYYLGGRMTAKAPILRKGLADTKVKLIQIDGQDDKTIVDMFFTAKGLHHLAAAFNADMLPL